MTYLLLLLDRLKGDKISVSLAKGVSVEGGFAISIFFLLALIVLLG
ncbi:MAG TPA: hypothetical protein VF582_04755 [Allosphingosinicella sp.]|jgi:hypothetical protein